MSIVRIEQTLVTLANSSPSTHERLAICDHIMQGHMAGTFARFNNPKEEVSAHFGISLTGQIVQYVSLDRWAYANGVLEATPDLSIPWLADCWNMRNTSNPKNPNWFTYSIEHEGQPGQVFPEQQYQSSLFLHKYLMARSPNILATRKHIIGHYQISPKSRPECPSDTFPFDRLIQDLKGVNPMPARKVPGDFDVIPAFTDFWFNNGGLPIFGYPISEARQVQPGQYGQAINIQWFERARFELQHNGAVLLGLVGREAQKFSASL